MQLPRPQPLTSESERLAQLRRAVQPAQSNDSQAISQWLHRTVGSAPLGGVSRQVEELFWPAHHSHDEHKQQMMHSSYRNASMPPILSARPSSSAAATPLIPDPHSLPYLRSEIDLLRRQTQAHLVKDLAYDDLILENRALKSQLGLVKEMEHKIAEMKTMAEEKEQRRRQQIEAMGSDYDALSAKYEATLQELVQSQSMCKMQANQNAQLIGTMSEAGIALEDLRSKLGATTMALEDLQSTRNTTARDLEIASSQLDALRVAHGHLKSELESRVEEVSTLHRMREMQTAQLSTLRAAAVEASAKITQLERDNQGLSSVAALRAELVDSQSSLALAHVSLSGLQNKVDSLEALLEEQQHRERNGWVPPEMQDEVDVTDLMRELAANNAATASAIDDANAACSEPASAGFTSADETDVDGGHEAAEEKSNPAIASATVAPTASAVSSPSLAPVAPAAPSSAAPSPFPRPARVKKPSSIATTAKPAPGASSRSPAAAAAASKAFLSVGVPVKKLVSSSSSTSLSRKLEKCLTDSLRDNSSLVASVAALKLTNKSLGQREVQATQRVAALQTMQAELQSQLDQSQRDAQALEYALDRKSRRVLELQSELAEAENLLSARQEALRKTQAELSSLKAANQSLEAASKLDASRLERDLKAMQSRFAVEVAAHESAQKDMQTMRADHAALLNQHGLTLQAKESLSANFARTVAANGELSVRLAVAEASAARTKSADERAVAAERALEHSNAMLTRLSGEVDTLQKSLQSLSESHTDLTASLHKAQSKAAALGLDNAKAHTRINNLVHQIASEEHAKSSSAGQVRLMEVEWAAAKEQLEMLQARMVEEQRAAAITLEAYRNARKEGVSSKTKLAACRKVEAQVRAALDKEMAKNKRLEVEMSRLRQVAVVVSASSSSRPATGSLEDMPLAQAHSQYKAAISRGGTPGSSSLLAIPAEIANFESSAAHDDDVTASAADSQVEGDDPSSGFASPLMGQGSPSQPGSPLVLARRLSPSRSPSLQSLSDRFGTATPPPLAHSVLLAVPVAPLEQRALTPEEAAMAEAARKREEERRMKRRVPKQRAHAATTAVVTPATPPLASSSIALTAASTTASSATAPPSAPADSTRPSKRHSNPRKSSKAAGTSSDSAVSSAK